MKKAARVSYNALKNTIKERKQVPGSTNLSRNIENEQPTIWNKNSNISHKDNWHVHESLNVR